MARTFRASATHGCQGALEHWRGMNWQLSAPNPSRSPITCMEFACGRPAWTNGSAPGP